MLCMIWMLTATGAGASHLLPFFIRPLPDSYKTQEESTIKQKASHQVTKQGKILKSVIKSKLALFFIYTGLSFYGGEFTHKRKWTGYL